MAFFRGVRLLIFEIFFWDVGCAEEAPGACAQGDPWGLLVPLTGRSGGPGGFVGRAFSGGLFFCGAMKISPNKSPANNSTAPLSPRPVRVARVAPGSLDPWGLTNPHNGQRGGPGCRQGPRPPCGPLGVNPLSFPQFCPQHVNKTAHISVHMNVDRNKDRVHDVIWTNIEKSAIRR